MSRKMLLVETVGREGGELYGISSAVRDAERKTGYPMRIAGMLEYEYRIGDRLVMGRRPIGPKRAARRRRKL